MTHTPAGDAGKVFPTDRNALSDSPERLSCMSGKTLLTGGKGSSGRRERLFRGFGKVIPGRKIMQTTDLQYINQTA